MKKIFVKASRYANDLKKEPNYCVENLGLVKFILLSLLLGCSLFYSSCKKGDNYTPPDNSVIISEIDNGPDYSFEQIFYVRPPGLTYGTGDGSSWANAFSDLPENLVRGAKYYLATGDYDVGPYEEYYEWHSFNDAEDEDKYIAIYKATATNHGITDGWETSFGEGVANIGPISFTTGNYIIDGQVGEKTSGHGFKITTQDCDNWEAKLVRFPWNSTSHHIMLKHIDMEHCGNYGYGSLHPAHDAIKGDPVEDANPGVKLKYLYFINCYMHDANRAIVTLLDGENILFEGCYFARSGLHQECSTIGIRYSKNIIFRRNIFEDTKNVFFSLRWVENFYIYSNIFIGNIDNGHWTIYSAIENTVGYARNIHIYGNTFYNLKGLASGVRLLGENSHVFTENNLWANCKTNQINLNGEHSHNAFYENYRVDGDSPVKLDENIDEETKQVLTEEPFMDAGTYDFRLNYATESGTPIDAPFNIDFNGNIRGQDGIWDRGAYEYQ